MPSKPVLIYDGECGFCRLWLDYAQALLGVSVEWLPSRQIRDRFPEIDRTEFKRTVVFVDGAGSVHYGAGAIFTLLALAPNRGFWLWLYHVLPPFRWISEGTYGWIAAHRNAAYTLTKYSFGRVIRPLNYRITESLFLRVLGIVYWFAFASLQGQIVGLIGAHGITPVARAMAAMHSEAGWKAVLVVPSIFWFGNSDSWLLWVCNAGMIASVVLTIGGWLGQWWQRVAALFCFVLYLSVSTIGQPFTLFQWDALLTEAGFLAIFSGIPFLVWPYRLLLFRLMFESGCVKLLSHDPSWRNLHALRFHFMTQPLPNPPAYYVYQSPGWILDTLTLLTLLIEIICPWLLFLPRRIRHFGIGLLIVLQVCILLTGNYAFFNWLSIALCLWAFDDRAFSKLTHFLRRSTVLVRSIAVRQAATVVLAALMLLGGLQAVALFAPSVERPFARLLAFLAPWQIVNSYGLFAVMTTTRPEVIYEGSNDGQHWREYSFKYKPGNTHRSLPLIAPLQPRLDWQLWFAALGAYQENPWTGNLAVRLLQGEPAVLNLMNPPPFSKPPKFIRASIYDYWFTTPAERRKTGAIWNRRYERVFIPAFSLDMLRPGQ